MADAHDPLRVLQLLGDTDPAPAHLEALELHRSLTRLGVEVRTLALAPGRRGGLDGTVPVMAPSRRSWTIAKVVDREARWADVVLLQAPGALVGATRRRPGGPPVVARFPEGHLLPLDLAGVDEVVVASPVVSAVEGRPDDTVTVTALTPPVDATTWRTLLAARALGTV